MMASGSDHAGFSVFRTVVGDHSFSKRSEKQCMWAQHLPHGAVQLGEGLGGHQPGFVSSIFPHKALVEFSKLFCCVKHFLNTPMKTV